LFECTAGSLPFSSCYVCYDVENEYWFLTRYWQSSITPVYTTPAVGCSSTNYHLVAFSMSFLPSGYDWKVSVHAKLYENATGCGTAEDWVDDATSFDEYQTY